MSKAVYTDTHGSAKVTGSKIPVAAEEEHDNLEFLLLLRVEGEEEPLAFPLSEVQVFIIMQSLLYKNKHGKLTEYSDKRLARSIDRKEALNGLAYSIEQAAKILDREKICSGAIVSHQKGVDEVLGGFHLSYIQGAVVIARLGIDLELGHAISDEDLESLYGFDWEPRFNPDPPRRRRI